MENQHRQIKGYRELNAQEIKAMNAVKSESERIGLLIEEMRANPDLDQRWVSIAETHLQQGFMAAVRAVAKPTTF